MDRRVAVAAVVVAAVGSAILWRHRASTSVFADSFETWSRQEHCTNVLSETGWRDGTCARVCSGRWCCQSFIDLETGLTTGYTRSIGDMTVPSRTTVINPES